jgi:hypothetical protein
MNKWSEPGFAGRKDEQDFKKFSVEVRVSLRVKPSLNENINPENSKTGGILIKNWGKAAIRNPVEALRYE